MAEPSLHMEQSCREFWEMKLLDFQILEDHREALKSLAWTRVNQFVDSTTEAS